MVLRYVTVVHQNCKVPKSAFQTSTRIPIKINCNTRQSNSRARKNKSKSPHFSSWLGSQLHWGAERIGGKN